MSTIKIGQTLRIAYIGGGSQGWAPTILRDIIFKPGLDRCELDIRLLDLSRPRAQAIAELFAVKTREWQVADRVRVTVAEDAVAALSGADFVLITISTGRLEAMHHDIAIPERYGILHTVGDTSGPGGWARSLRNIPVFRDYAELIRKHAPAAYVLNYTNPMGTLTQVLADVLGRQRVVGLCHGLFECYDVLSRIFNVSEADIQVRFGGVNHFFWILDLAIGGRDGYAMLRRRLKGRRFAELVKEAHPDAMGWQSDKWLSSELFEQYGYLPYVGDRHTCEFFGCYITDPEMMKRFRLVRTPVSERRENYRRAEKVIRAWTGGRNPGWQLSPKPSRETAADIIAAIAGGREFTDVVNTVNVGQIANLPMGAVVETLGRVDRLGFTPLTCGPLPEALCALVRPHAEVQLRTVAAGLAGDREAALLALAADPACGRLTACDVRKMGLELLRAHGKHLPQFVKESPP
jgi:alpha-galactosidase/6-phospho-beta-glucosidase family protein